MTRNEIKTTKKRDHNSARTPNIFETNEHISAQQSFNTNSFSLDESPMFSINSVKWATIRNYIHYRLKLAAVMTLLCIGTVCCGLLELKEAPIELAASGVVWILIDFCSGVIDLKLTWFALTDALPDKERFAVLKTRCLNIRDSLDLINWFVDALIFFVHYAVSIWRYLFADFLPRNINKEMVHANVVNLKPYLTSANQPDDFKQLLLTRKYQQFAEEKIALFLVDEQKHQIEYDAACLRMKNIWQAALVLSDMILFKKLFPGDDDAIKPSSTSINSKARQHCENVNTTRSEIDGKLQTYFIEIANIVPVAFNKWLLTLPQYPVVFKVNTIAKVIAQLELYHSASLNEPQTALDKFPLLQYANFPPMAPFIQLLHWLKSKEISDYGRQYLTETQLVWATKLIEQLTDMLITECKAALHVITEQKNMMATLVESVREYVLQKEYNVPNKSFSLLWAVSRSQSTKEQLQQLKSDWEGDFKFKTKIPLLKFVLLHQLYEKFPMEAQKIQQLFIDYWNNNVVVTTLTNGKHRIHQRTQPIVVLSSAISSFCNVDNRELRIIASEKIFINVSLIKDRFHGVNIVLVAPVIEVIGYCVIDVSGRNGLDAQQPPKRKGQKWRSKDGIDGADADHGKPGDSGGHILIRCDSLINGAGLTLRSNGGNGGNGANGGDGADGLDGEDGQNGEEKWPAAGIHIYKLFSKGRKGTPGGKGGDGGGRGLGGEAGLNGDIHLLKLQDNSLLHGPFIDRLSIPNSGKNDYRRGHGGRAGKRGKDGLDVVCWKNDGSNRKVEKGYFNREDEDEVEYKQVFINCNQFGAYPAKNQPRVHSPTAKKFYDPYNYESFAVQPDLVSNETRMSVVSNPKIDLTVNDIIANHNALDDIKIAMDKVKSQIGAVQAKIKNNDTALQKQGMQLISQQNLEKQDTLFNKKHDHSPRNNDNDLVQFLRYHTTIQSLNIRLGDVTQSRSFDKIRCLINSRVSELEIEFANDLLFDSLIFDAHVFVDCLVSAIKEFITRKSLRVEEERWWLEIEKIIEEKQVHEWIPAFRSVEDCCGLLRAWQLCPASSMSSVENFIKAIQSDHSLQLLFHVLHSQITSLKDKPHLLEPWAYFAKALTKLTELKTLPPFYFANCVHALIQTPIVYWCDKVEVELLKEKLRRQFHSNQGTPPQEIVDNIIYQLNKVEVQFGKGVASAINAKILKHDSATLCDSIDKSLKLLFEHIHQHGDAILDILLTKPVTDWTNTIEKGVQQFSILNAELSIEMLVKKFIENANNSDIRSRINPHNIRTLLRKICVEEYPASGLDVKGIFTQWKDVFKQCLQREFHAILTNSNELDTLVELFRTIAKAIETVFDYQPRASQWLAVVVSLCRLGGRGNLLEVHTGEGKSIIVMILALLHAIAGREVDIFTSSKTLAVRDADKAKNFFELFDITVDHNCYDTEQDRRNSYTKRVVYGETSMFQRDYLVDKFTIFDDNNNGPIRGNRSFKGVAIVDEVDSMFLDKGDQMLYLSQPIPGMELLEPLYIQIWLAVNSAGIGLSLKEDTETIKKFIDDSIRNGEIRFPQFLKDFVTLRIPDWIESAWIAKFGLQKNDSYRLSMESRDGVMVVNKQTGELMPQTHLTNGIHQFLQFKHCHRFHAESLKSIFISNSKFFSLYSTLSGLTGTLGSEVEYKLMQKLYGLSFACIPTFRSSLRKVYSEIVTNSMEDRNKKIVEVCKDMQRLKRAVLVINDSIAEVLTLSKACEEAGVENCFRYATQYDKLHDTVHAQDVILATNLAGRGTDILLDSSVERAGGLHVILTYVPDNLRIERQAFGRAARKGERGSVQYIIADDTVNNSSNSLNKLLFERNHREEHRLQALKDYRDLQIKLEESLLDSFYEQIIIPLTLANHNPVNHSICCDLLDQFAFWLDRHQTLIRQVKGENSAVEQQVRGKLREFVRDCTVATENRSQLMLNMKNSFYLVAVGKQMFGKGQHDLAMKYFTMVRDKEFAFADVADYYSSATVINSEIKNGKNLSIMSLTRARCQYMRRMEEYSNYASLMEQIQKVCREEQGLGQEPDFYSSQIENKLLIYQTLITSIDDAIGSMVTDLSGLASTHLTVEDEEFVKHRLLQSELFTDYHIVSEFEWSSPRILGHWRSSDYSEETKAEVIAFIVENQSFSLADIERKVTKSIGYAEDFLQQLSYAGLVSERKGRCAPLLITLTALTAGEKKGEIFTQQEQSPRFITSSVPKVYHTTIQTVTEQVKHCRVVIENEGQTKGRGVCQRVWCPTFIKHLKCDLILEIDWEENVKSMPNMLYCHLKRDSASKQFYIWCTVDSERCFLSVEAETNHVMNTAKAESEIIAFFSNKALLMKYPHITPLQAQFLAAKKRSSAQETSFVMSELQLPTRRNVYRRLVAHLQQNLIIHPRQLNKEFRYDRRRCDTLIREIVSANHPQVALICQDFWTALQKKFDTMDGRIQKGGTLTATTESLQQELHAQLTGELLQDLHQATLLGIDSLVRFKEVPSWWAVLVVFLIGIAELVLGACLTVIGLPNIGAAFISEGMGDIMYAMEAVLTSTFNWAEYLKHKAISVVMTVLSCGITSFLNKGVAVATATWRTGVKSVLSKGLQAITQAIAMFSINKLLDETIGKLVELIASKLMDSLQGSFVAIQEKLTHVLTVTGNSQGVKALIESLGKGWFDSESMSDKLLQYTSYALTVLKEGFLDAANGRNMNLGKFQSLELLGMVVKAVQKTIEICANLAQALSITKSFVDSMLIDIDQRMTHIATATDTPIVVDPTLITTAINNWKDMLTKKVTAYLHQGIVQPTMRSFIYKNLNKVAIHHWQAMKTALGINTLFHDQKYEDSLLEARKQNISKIAAKEFCSESGNSASIGEVLRYRHEIEWIEPAAHETCVNTGGHTVQRLREQIPGAMFFSVGHGEHRRILFLPPVLFESAIENSLSKALYEQHPLFASATPGIQLLTVINEGNRLGHRQIRLTQDGRVIDLEPLRSGGNYCDEQARLFQAKLVEVGKDGPYSEEHIRIAKEFAETPEHVYRLRQRVWREGSKVIALTPHLILHQDVLMGLKGKELDGLKAEEAYYFIENHQQCEDKLRAEIDYFYRKSEHEQLLSMRSMTNRKQRDAENLFRLFPNEKMPELAQELVSQGIPNTTMSLHHIIPEVQIRNHLLGEGSGQRRISKDELWEYYKDLHPVQRNRIFFAKEQNKISDLLSGLVTTMCYDCRNLRIGPDPKQRSDDPGGAIDFALIPERKRGAVERILNGGLPIHKQLKELGKMNLPQALFGRHYDTHSGEQRWRVVDYKPMHVSDLLTGGKAYHAPEYNPMTGKYQFRPN